MVPDKTQTQRQMRDRPVCPPPKVALVAVRGPSPGEGKKEKIGQGSGRLAGGKKMS